MAVSRDAIQTHKEKYGVMYMITLIGSLLPILTMGGYILNSFNNLATDLEVASAISAHNSTDMHPAAQSAVSQVDHKIDSILLFQLEDRIEKLLRVVCTNPDMRTQLNETFRSLIQQYNGISPRPYQRPTCAQLGA